MIVSVPIRGLFNLTNAENATVIGSNNGTVFPSPLGDYLI